MKGSLRSIAMIAAVLLVAPAFADAAPTSQNQQYQKQHAAPRHSTKHKKSRQRAAHAHAHAKSVNATGTAHAKLTEQSANAKHARAAAHKRAAKKRKAA